MFYLYFCNCMYPFWVIKYKECHTFFRFLFPLLLMVGTDGYAPSTFSMSMKHSTIELSPPLVQDPRLSHSDTNFKIIIFLALGT